MNASWTMVAADRDGPCRPVGNAGRDASAWRAGDLDGDQRWVIQLTEAERADLLEALKIGLAKVNALQPGALLASSREDFPFGEGVIARLRDGLHEAEHGCGLCLIKGLPREGLGADDFGLLTWAIGLHLGVARPQDVQSRYLNAVRDAGVDYRSATGRGYSSRAELDFHVDSGDVVLLSCFNAALSGGESIISSGVAAWRQLLAERPDLAHVLETEAVAFSRQGEQGDGEPAFYRTTVFTRTDTDVFCAWNRNRIVNGMKLDGAPHPSAAFLEGIELLDAILRRPEFLFRMWLEPGDVQILSNYTVLHSRTSFEDHADEARRRTLFRLWLATPNGLRLPAGWKDRWGAEEPGVVKGGIRGHHYTEACSRFERRQAIALGMRLG